MASSEIKEDLLPGETLEMICRNIYLSCSTEGTDEVPTLKLIEFVKPYLEKHPSALKSLQADMDPLGANVGIPYQIFLEKMSMWVEKILDSHENNEALNQTPRNMEENLVFAQSTPRQRRWSNSKPFNITDPVSSDEDLSDMEETNYRSKSLSDEIKIIERVTYQKNKVLSENELLKNQVAAAEEQIEKLEAELDRYRMRLINEQNLNELLKKDQMDEIKEEINKNEQKMETYIKKLQDYERDNLYINSLNKQLESENAKLLQNCDTLETEKQAMRVEIEELKTVIESKDMELSDLMKQMTVLEEDLKHKIFLNKDLEDENEFLDHQKVSLEKQLSFNTRLMSPILSISQKNDNCIPVYSINKQQQKFTPLRYSYPIKMINSGCENLNSSLPTKLNESVNALYNCYRFPVASGRDLHESFMLSTSLTDQSIKLKEYPQVSLQAELSEAQGSVSEDCQDNKLLKALRDELRRVKQGRQELEEEYEAYKQEVADNNKSNFDIVEEMERLKQLCNNYKETIEKISKSNSELETTVKQNKINSDLLIQLENKISNMENEVELKTKRMELLESKLRIRKRIINMTRRNLQRRKILIKELNDRNEQLSKKYKDKLQSHDKLVRELEMTKQHVVKLSRDLQVTNQQSNNNINTKETQLTEALNEIARQQKLIENLSIRVKPSTEREQPLEIVNQNYEGRITNLVEQLALRTEELNIAKESYEYRTASLAKRLDETTQELNVMKQRYEETLSKTNGKLNVLKHKYEETIFNLSEQLAEKTNELIEAKRKLNETKKDYETLISSQAMELEGAKLEIAVRDNDNESQFDVHPVNISQMKGCDLQEDNNSRWIIPATMIITFALIFVYWHCQEIDFDQVCLFNFIQELHIGNPPS